MRGTSTGDGEALLKRDASPARLPARGALLARTLLAAGALALSATFAASAHAAPAPAPKPPAVYTGYASAMTTSSATVRAKINPHGLATEYRFEYGPTAAYGADTPPAAAGSGTQESLLTQTIGDLQPDTSYHYRAAATNSAGTTYGQDATFTTKKVPLTLTLAMTPDPVVFGNALTVSGTLAGTGNAGVEVVLQGNQFPYTHGFEALTSPEPTSATGAFSFPVSGLLESTQLRATTAAKPAIFSPVVTELVTVRVTLHVRPARRRGFVRLYGTVTPAEPGAAVAFELMNREHRYVTISGTRIQDDGAGGVSRFARTVRLRQRGLYRALVPVVAGAQTSGRSRPVLIR
jgi:hypothetical protein